MADEQQQQKQGDLPEQQEEQQPQYKRWNTRPESTIAQNFALDLDSMFGLGAAEAANELSMNVQEKKASVTSREQTLQELEAKLRETEERLAKVSRHSSPSRQQEQANTAVPRSHLSPDSKQAADGAPRSSPLGAQPTYPADRPPTSNDERPNAARQDTDALMSNIPGAMPGTPQQQYSGNNNEYVMVDRNLSAGQAQREYG